MGYVYFIYSCNDNKCKIGFSKNHPSKRLKQLNTGNSSSLLLLGYIEGNMKIEKNIRNQFHYLWENLEWLNIDESLIQYINSNNQLDVYVDWLDGKLQVYKKMKK